MSLLHLSGYILGDECSETWLEWKKLICRFEWTIWKGAIVVSYNPSSLNHLLYIGKTGSAFWVFAYTTPERRKLLAGKSVIKAGDKTFQTLKWINFILETSEVVTSMMPIHSKEEKNDILIEKFFLGYPSSLSWAQHLSWADVGFLSCLEIQVSFFKCIITTSIS